MRTAITTKYRSGKWRGGRALAASVRAFIPLRNVALCGAGLLLFYFLFKRQRATKVSIDVTVSALEWKTAEPTGKNLDWFGFEITANDSSAFVLPPATITSNSTGHPFDGTAPLILLPLRPFRPVQVRALGFPNESRVRLTQADTTMLKMEVSSANTADTTTVLRWQVLFHQRACLNPSTGAPDTLGRADANAYPPCELAMSKSLRSGEKYYFDFSRAHPWKAPTRLLATELIFAESDGQETEAISSVLSGTIKLLETTEPPIAIAERDVLNVTFTKPVEIYLRGTPAGIALHVDGIATQLLCGPKIMGDETDLMPPLIRSYYDKTPYTIALLTALLPLVWPTLSKSKKR